MRYDDAVAAFFAPRPDAAVPAVVGSPTPARRLRDAVEPIAMHDVWARAVNERMASYGLDFLSNYVGGRAAVLGAPAAPVVAAAFAWFAPPLVVAVHEAAAAALPAAELLRVRDEAVAASLAEALHGEDPTELAATADRLFDAGEPQDAAGRPLFAGVRALGRPDDPFLRLWRACDLLREHRGDSHVMAAGAAGLGPVEMNVLTELWLGMPLLSYTATRGWSADQTDAALQGLRAQGLLDGDTLSEAGRQLREQVEQTTNRQEQGVVDALGADLEPLCERLSAWSARCVDAGAFPPDPLKRAAG